MYVLVLKTTICRTLATCPVYRNLREDWATDHEPLRDAITSLQLLHLPEVQMFSSTLRFHPRCKPSVSH